MRITQIMLGKGFGGGERYFVDLAVALAGCGHAVQALCHEDFVARGRLEGHPGLRVTPVRARGMWDRWSLRQLRLQAADFGPEVMHSHMARAAWAGGAAASRLGVPLVATLHNYVKLKYYRHVDAYIPTTESQAAYLRAAGVAEERIHRIPNFSSLAPAARAWRPAGAPVRFVSCGRMVPKKGIHVLLEAFRRLLDNPPAGAPGGGLDGGIDARLAIGGDGPERTRLERLARSLDLGARVSFPGWIEDVAEFIAGGDVFVLPSLDEPFGIVMLEAMASGRAVVTTRTHGPVEVLDESTAWFAEIGDAASLAAAMARAAGDPAASERKAASALERYRERYHRDAVVPRIVAVYAALREAALRS